MHAMKRTLGPVILLIENEESDVYFFKRALSQVNFTGTVRVAGSVGEAREYLEGEGLFADRDYFPLPDLIVSDMNLPGLPGNYFLEWLRGEPEFSIIPFVFLSGSFLPAERTQALDLGAGGFFVKTSDSQLMKDRVRSLLKFLPPQPKARKAETEAQA